MAQPAKRRRLEITAGIKKKVCQHKVDHPKATIQDIRQFILTEDALDIGKSTIGDINDWRSTDPTTYKTYLSGKFVYPERMIGNQSVRFTGGRLYKKLD